MADIGIRRAVSDCSAYVEMADGLFRAVCDNCRWIGPLSGLTAAQDDAAWHDADADQALQSGACAHESADGVDTTPPDDPNKVWRCNMCGSLFINTPTPTGATRTEGDSATNAPGLDRARALLSWIDGACVDEAPHKEIREAIGRWRDQQLESVSIQTGSNDG